MSAPPPVGREQSVLDALRARLGPAIIDTKRGAPRRATARVPPGAVRDAISLLQSLGCRHLSAISGVDAGDSIEVLYHLSGPEGLVVSLRTAVPKKDPRLRTVTDALPSAVLYEREVHDLLGVVFDGHPDPRRLLLHEGWPEGEYPLRKDWKPAATEARKHA